MNLIQGYIKIISVASFTFHSFHRQLHYHSPATYYRGTAEGRVLVGVVLLKNKIYYPTTTFPTTFRKTRSTRDDNSKDLITNENLTELHVHQRGRKHWHFTHPTDVPATTPRRPYGRFLTSLFRFVIVHLTKFIMTWRNKTYLHDDKDNIRYLFNREDDVGVLTISNHQSVADDPGIWCGTIPLKFLTLDAIRTIVMAEEWYYSAGKISAGILRGLNCIPIRRGDLRGLENPSLEEMHRRLNGITIECDNNKNDDNNNNKKKAWAHIMVEGRIYQSWRFAPDEPRLGKFRRGAAKLIACSPPSKTMVIPIYHRGMDEIFPEEKPIGWNLLENSQRVVGKTKSFFPKGGKEVHVHVGDPLDFSDLVPPNGHPFHETTDRALLERINQRLYNSMRVLESRAYERDKSDHQEIHKRSNNH